MFIVYNNWTWGRLYIVALYGIISCTSGTYMKDGDSFFAISPWLMSVFGWVDVWELEIRQKNGEEEEHGDW